MDKLIKDFEISIRYGDYMTVSRGTPEEEVIWVDGLMTAMRVNVTGHYKTDIICCDYIVKTEQAERLFGRIILQSMEKIEEKAHEMVAIEKAGSILRDNKA